MLPVTVMTVLLPVSGGILILSLAQMLAFERFSLRTLFVALTALIIFAVALTTLG
jgi:hypothetical protein